MALDGPGPDLAAALGAEVAGLERELAEVELLVGQARTEAARHEQKRAAVAERLAAVSSAAERDPAELADLNAQLITLTRRAAVMESQIDVLEGKQKTLARYRDSLAAIRDRIATGEVAVAPEPAGGQAGSGSTAPPGADEAGGQPRAAAGPEAVARLVLTAQEDLRRDIARAIHDGPAQSLTNIVLQAQILDRLLEHDPAAARAELDELVAMVQRTLEATKTFIFDVRPMVLDDLGLVPTLRRLARDRSRRGTVAVEFESYGPDRRLPMETESAIFRIADEAVAALAATRPDRVTVALDWGEEEVETRVAAHRPDAPAAEPEPGPPPDLPPALAAFLEERRAARPAPRPAEAIPADLRRELAERASSVGGRLTVEPEGGELRLVVHVAAATVE